MGRVRMKKNRWFGLCDSGMMCVWGGCGEGEVVAVLEDWIMRVKGRGMMLIYAYVNLHALVRERMSQMFKLN